MDKQQIIQLAENLLRNGQATEVKASGISMFPLLKPGDILHIQPDGNYAVGDIVVFKGKDTLIAHRLIKIDGHTYICRGDSLSDFDPAMDLPSILGKVIARKRKNHLKSSHSLAFRFFATIMPRCGKALAPWFRYWAIIYLKLKNKLESEN